MTNIVRVTVLPVLLIILATTFSIPLAEAGISILQISKVEPGMVVMNFGGPVEEIELGDEDLVQICNELLEDAVLLTIRDKNGNVFFEESLGPGKCADEFLDDGELSVGDSQLPGGGSQYKVSGGSFILVNACSVEPGQQTSFSLGICPEVEGQVIGGTLIPIDATSLLVVGVQTNYSILTALVVGGAGFVLFKLKRK